MSLATVPTNKSVSKFINSLETKKEDSKVLLKLISKITGKKPKIWGDSFVAFGRYTYTRKGSKKEYEWFNVAFAPRKDKITLYLTCYLENEPLVKKLGKVKHGKGCLHIRKLDDVDLDILKKLITKYKDGSWF